MGSTASLLGEGVNSTRRASVIDCAATVGAIESTSAIAAIPHREIPTLASFAPDIRADRRSGAHHPSEVSSIRRAIPQ